MIKCINCNYYYTDGKTEYCCYYNDEISMIIIRSMCSWIEEDDKTEEHVGNSEKLQRV